jgi:hypothetical protein
VHLYLQDTDLSAKRIIQWQLNYAVIQKDQVEGMPSILSPSLGPSRQGREVKGCHTQRWSQFT